MRGGNGHCPPPSPLEICKDAKIRINDNDMVTLMHHYNGYIEMIDMIDIKECI